MRLAEKELASVRTIGSWPTRSSNRNGAVFTRQHPIGGARRHGLSFGGRKERIAQQRPLLAEKGRWRSISSFVSLDGPPLGGEGELRSRSPGRCRPKRVSGRLDKDPPWLVRAASFRT